MGAELPLLPLRMLNEHVYCPRLFALEWLNGEWADSADTVQGRTVHRRVDKPTRKGLPEPDEGGDDPPEAIRSVYLGDRDLGLIGKIDLVEAEGERVVPVDYKKGRPAPTPEGAWDPERVQIRAQALLLRAHGYTCDEGVLYFAAARRRVAVPITDDLVQLTLEQRDQALAVARAGKLPPPLVDSPKCPRCSLVGICLPDEHNRLQQGEGVVRPMIPPRDDAMPLYVQQYGGVLRKDHGEIVVRNRDKEEIGRARLAETSRVVLMGNATITTPLLHALAKRDIPVAYHSYGGWFRGHFAAASGHNVLTRIAQHRVASDPQAALDLARQFVAGKILNTRVLLRRNGDMVPDDALHRMRELADEALRAPQIDSLLGLEGGAARLYFRHFPQMIKSGLRGAFEFTRRNRRPPTDPVNALLSFAYACLAREVTTTIDGIGLDPYVGFLHQPRPGRPALALDLMEEFRPVIADSAVLSAINNGVVGPGDFIERTTGTALRKGGRRGFVKTFERRLDEEATHPVFGTRLSYRRILEVQARLLGKVLLGELDEYPQYRIR